MAFGDRFKPEWYLHASSATLNDYPILIGCAEHNSMYRAVLWLCMDFLTIQPRKPALGKIRPGVAFAAAVAAFEQILHQWLKRRQKQPWAPPS